MHCVNRKDGSKKVKKIFLIADNNTTERMNECVTSSDVSSFYLSLSLSISLSHTHTHTHTHDIQRDRIFISSAKNVQLKMRLTLLTRSTLLTFSFRIQNHLLFTFALFPGFLFQHSFCSFDFSLFVLSRSIVRP